ncbi:MAG: hypothetical protein EOM53_01330 [Alphaproteobacteria bacterium]|nr:hypothetical protein [Alphaproteobacteria bacterium]
MKKRYALFFGMIFSLLCVKNAQAFLNIDPLNLVQNSEDLLNQLSENYGKISKNSDLDQKLKSIGQFGKTQERIDEAIEKDTGMKYVPTTKNTEKLYGKPFKSVKNAQKYIKETFYYPLQIKARSSSKKYKAVLAHRGTYQLEVLSRTKAYIDSYEAEMDSSFKEKEEALIQNISSATDLRDDVSNNTAAIFLLMSETIPQIQLRLALLELDFAKELKYQEVYYIEPQETTKEGE